MKVIFNQSVALCLVAILLGACATSAPTAIATSGRPNWIDNPGDGVSASANYHIRGRVAQEELAISRAREELAKRQGVKIESENNIQQRYAAGRLSTVTDKQTSETVTGVEVKSQVKEKWIDPDSGIIWVWVVPAR